MGEVIRLPVVKLDEVGRVVQTLLENAGLDADGVAVVRDRFLTTYERLRRTDPYTLKLPAGEDPISPALLGRIEVGIGALMNEVAQDVTHRALVEILQLEARIYRLERGIAT